MPFKLLTVNENNGSSDFAISHSSKFPVPIKYRHLSELKRVIRITDGNELSIAEIDTKLIGKAPAKTINFGVLDIADIDELLLSLTEAKEFMEANLIMSKLSN